MDVRVEEVRIKEPRRLVTIELKDGTTKEAAYVGKERIDMRGDSEGHRHEARYQAMIRAPFGAEVYDIDFRRKESGNDQWDYHVEYWANVEYYWTLDEDRDIREQLEELEASI